MNQRKKFEHNFKNSCERDSVFCLRLTDSDLSFNPNKELRSKFSIKQPCDFLVYYNGYLFTLELKNTKGKNFSFQRDPKLPDGMIHYHQINSLVNMGLYDGIISRFVLNFRQEPDEKHDLDERTFFLSIDDFSSDKRSINMKEVIEYGGIEIESNRKRTQFTYATKNGFEEIIKQKGDL